MNIPQESPLSIIGRLQDAINRHDLEAFLECIDPDYQSEQPTHPDRAFQGRAQVQKNWSAIFAGVPDIHAEQLRSVVSDNTAWTEWHWRGTRADGTQLDMRGVTLFGTQNSRILWGRLYMEQVEAGGAGINANTKSIAQGQQSEG